MKQDKYDTFKQCSAATGIPVPVLKQAKKSGCPAFKHGRIDVFEFIRWYFSSNDPEAGKNWSDILKRWQAEREEIKLQKDRGELMSIADAKQQAATAEAYYFGELDRAMRELPPVLSGLDALQVHARLKTYFEAMREASREFFKVKPTKEAKA